MLEDGISPIKEAKSDFIPSLQVTTWVDRITDEHGTWLNAAKSEEQNDLPRAVELYLADASGSLGKGMLAKAGLSVSCAADCLARLGLAGQARKLSREAASIYLENADKMAGTSVRELLWSLKESYLCFASAGEVASAEEVRRRYEAVLTRTNPFGVHVDLGSGLAGPGWLDQDKVERPSVTHLVESFLQSRREGRYPAQDAEGPRWRIGQVDEKSIIDQLG